MVEFEDQALQFATRFNRVERFKLKTATMDEEAAGRDKYHISYSFCHFHHTMDVLWCQQIKDLSLLIN